MSAGAGTVVAPSVEESLAILERIRELRHEFVELLVRMVEVESPTDEPVSQSGVQAILRDALGEIGFESRHLPGRGRSGGHLYARPAVRRRGRPSQLIVGHTDTVWPMGTLETMPVRRVDDRLHGPGSLDMKGGLAVAVFALRALHELGYEPQVTPVLFINSDEEVGSPESRVNVRRLARAACRAFVLEPALGLAGLVKTARKGVGRFDLTITGRSAHAGLEPEAGASAILELAQVIPVLHGLNDPERGITVNVGVIDGGVRPNVVAPKARASVDVRVRTVEDGRRLQERILGLQPTLPGVAMTVEGGIHVPPMERTERNLRLWEMARSAGQEMGMELDHALAGGGSDGNTTSQYTATLDGLGCVGDGAHAEHEHVKIGPSLDRCALLARLLLAPPPEPV